MFLLAWIFLGAAIAGLYFGLSEEGRTLLYLSIAASAVTLVLALVQLRRGAPSRRRAARGPARPPAGATPDERAPSPGSSSSG